MKKFTFIICAILLLMSVNPVAAKGGPPGLTGDQINLLAGNHQEYPANTAFFIAHYWAVIPSLEDNNGRFDFKLEVDHQIVDETFLNHYVQRGDPNVLVTAWVFNFPDGMEGNHIFEGHWYCPCAYALELGLVSECSNPTAKIEAMYASTVVTFTAP